MDPLAFADTDTNGAEAIKHALYRDDNGALQILVTKQTERDRIIAIQNMLASMGYLEHQRFTGKLGEATIAAIRAFQKANGMRETGTFNNEFAKRVYAIAGEQEPPPGRIFVRQDFRRVFEAPVQILNSDNALGTHVFIATRGNANKLQWFALSVEGDDSAAALDRIAIPSTIRDAIERKLRPGSSLIIGDMAVNSAILPEGDDFLVLTNSSPGEVKVALPKPSVSASKVAKIKKVTQSAPKRRTKKIPTISTQRIYHHPWRSYGGGLFSRW